MADFTQTRSRRKRLLYTVKSLLRVQDAGLIRHKVPGPGFNRSLILTNESVDYAKTK